MNKKKNLLYKELAFGEKHLTCCRATELTPGTELKEDAQSKIVKNNEFISQSGSKQ